MLYSCIAIQTRGTGNVRCIGRLLRYTAVIYYSVIFLYRQLYSQYSVSGVNVLLHGLCLQFIQHHRHMTYYGGAYRTALFEHRACRERNREYMYTCKNEFMAIRKLVLLCTHHRTARRSVHFGYRHVLPDAGYFARAVAAALPGAWLSARIRSS